MKISTNFLSLVCGIFAVFLVIIALTLEWYTVKGGGFKASFYLTDFVVGSRHYKYSSKNDCKGQCVDMGDAGTGALALSIIGLLFFVPAIVLIIMELMKGSGFGLKFHFALTICGAAFFAGALAFYDSKIPNWGNNKEAHGGGYIVMILALIFVVLTVPKFICLAGRMGNGGSATKA